MNKIVIKSFFPLLFFFFTIYAQMHIVRIGDKSYTRNDIISQLSSHDLDPFVVVDNIKRNQAIKILAESKALNPKDAKKVAYRKLFGVSIEGDILRINDTVLPTDSQKVARLRMMLFERKIAAMAEEIIPVSFLDEKEFWELVKNSKSYKIRKQNGFDTPMLNWNYTWNELLVASDTVIAKKNDVIFLKGYELNLWIKRNYPQSIKAYAKRKYNKNDIVKVLSKQAVQGKLIAQKIADKKLVIKENYIERTVDNFIKDNMIISDFTITDFNAKEYSDVSEIVYNEYRDKSSSKINKLRGFLRGENSIISFDNIEAVYCAITAVGNMQIELTNAIDDSEIYDWIKERRFKGSFEESRRVIGREHFESLVKQNISQAGIVYD